MDTKNEDAIGLAPTETPMSERKTNLYLEQTPDEVNGMTPLTLFPSLQQFGHHLFVHIQLVGRG